MKKKRICIVTPGYIESDPRVIKEADLLHEKGFDVRVVFSEGNLEEIRMFDQQLLKRKKWRCDAVRWSPFRREERALFYKTKTRFHIMKRMPSFLWRFGSIAEYSEGRVYGELARLAAAERADLYIGHYPDGLSAAAYAASRWGAKLGCDVEDLYAEEEISGKRKRRIAYLEKQYLPRCDYVTVASDLYVDALRERYHVDSCRVIHNVFPLAEREDVDGKAKDRTGGYLSLYWFSQTIGESRGLEDAIRAVGLLGGRAKLHLRGTAFRQPRERLYAVARASKAEDHVYFHSLVSSKELLSRTAEHDVGLALEQPVSTNRMTCMSNKLFLYFLAGIAVAATDIPGQKQIMATCPGSGFLYTPGDHRALAAGLDRFIREPGALEACKEASRAAATTQWNWESEREKLFEIITGFL